MPSYDALLVVSFGGPEKRDDVIPFLENVLRGRNVPRERMLAVAEHYYHFDGRSPINDQVRELIAALRAELDAHGSSLPIYWGNRNWHPMLADTMRQMASDGVRRAVAFVTSAFSSYSGCRQYRENIEAARAEVPDAPVIDKIPVFHDDPDFIAAAADRVRAELDHMPDALVAFTAHSIPESMAKSCRYEQQLRNACALTAAQSGAREWQLVWQSRSGPPTQPWLAPDIVDYLREARPPRVVVAPIGFLSDHLEVIWDLDHEARAACDELGIAMRRAGAVGSHPRFVEMIRRLVDAQIRGEERREPGLCSENCCLPAIPTRSASGGTASVTLGR